MKNRVKWMTLVMSGLLLLGGCGMISEMPNPSTQQPVEETSGAGESITTDETGGAKEGASQDATGGAEESAATGDVAGNGESTATENGSQTEAGTAPVLSVSGKTKEWYLDGTDKTLLTVDYSLVTVENDGFDALRAALDEQFGGINEENYQDMLQEAKEYYEFCDEESKKYFWGYSTSETAKLTRCDSSLVSLRVTYSDYTGGAHGMYAIGGTTFDVETGEELELTDILTDVEGFYSKATAYISDKLYEEYADNLFSDYKEAVSQTFSGEWETLWYLNAAGIVIAYSPYELGPYAMGAPEVILPYSEFGDYIDEKYLGDYEEVIACVPTNVDISELIGAEQSIMLETKLNEWEMLNVKVAAGENDDELGDFDHLEDAYIIKRADGESFLMVVCDCMSDDYVTFVYKVTDGSLKKCAEMPNTYFRGERMSTERIEMFVNLNVLGTYQGKMDYILDAEGNLTPTEDIFTIDRASHMTVTKELPVTMNGAETTLSVGTQIMVTGTNNVDEVYFKVVNSDMTGTIRYTMDTTDSWTHLINGVSEYDYLEGLPYAG